MEQMAIVIVGHVDHGKSTVIGRLLADTGSLPEGKLEAVKKSCELSSKPFEYAFLLDALKDEQAQGITIDTARCFFKTDKRNYIILDAPGHIEFLKNMVTGASRAEAALLVIDANEGIQENSRRHGQLLSMLGIDQVTVLVNKMDLVAYSEDVFNSIRSEYSAFLAQLGVTPETFIPISAMNGVNLTAHSRDIGWYQGPTVLEQLDSFRNKPALSEAAFRLPVQDVYKFTAGGDDRRIVAGTVASGSIKVGSEVVFFPSGKKSRIKSFEAFNAESGDSISAGQAVGLTLDTQIYITPGEIMTAVDEAPPLSSSSFKTNLFWVGKAPLSKNREYKLKVHNAAVQVRVRDIGILLDSGSLDEERADGIREVGRHEVAEVTFDLLKPLAFDLAGDNENTGRFVIIDNYEIAGGGIILESLEDSNAFISDEVQFREQSWESGYVDYSQRRASYGHGSRLVVITGNDAEIFTEAKQLEQELFHRQYKTYYLGLQNLKELGNIRELGNITRVLTDAGLIVIAVIPGIDEFDVRNLRLLSRPNPISVIELGDQQLRNSADLSIRLKAELKKGVLGLLEAERIIPDYVI